MLAGHAVSAVGVSAFFEELPVQALPAVAAHEVVQAPELVHGRHVLAGYQRSAFPT